MSRGKFIVFEGGEGAGKDTQIDLLREPLNDVAVFTREPGGTPFGQEIRRLLLDSDYKLTPEAEGFLFLADRAEHLAKLIEPTLESGKHIITNRSFYSLLAYQIHGRNRHDMRPMMELAHDLLYKRTKPDLVILLDIPPEIGLERIKARGNLNYVDRAPMEVHERVRAGFLAELKDKPFAYIVDATPSVEEVHRVILERIQKEL